MFIQNKEGVRIVERTGSFVKQITAVEEGGEWSITIKACHRFVFARAEALSHCKMPKDYRPPHHSTVRFFKEHIQKFQGICHCIPMDDRRFRIYLRILQNMGKTILCAEPDYIQWEN